MFMSLFVVGLLLTAAGGALVGFGIPINEFSIGNTLIIAGTTAFVGGLVLIGLADAARQLRRIAESLMARPSPRTGRASESFEAMPAAGRPEAAPGRIPFPAKPKKEARGATPFEQRLAAAPSLDTAEEAFEPSEPSFPRMPGAGQPAGMPERDEAPLSPQEPARARREPHFAFSQMAMERREMDMRLNPRRDEPLPMSELDNDLRSAPSEETMRQNELFESFWPAKPPAGRAPGEEAEEEGAPRRGYAPQAPEPEEFPVEPQTEEPAEPPHAVSILKSGVVDGMAYTLYSDGSIEAEMPEGTVRFASINELRDYLERSS